MPISHVFKRSLAPVAKRVTPRRFWRRRYRILAESALQNDELRVLRQLCDPTKISLDIGADIGAFTVAMLDNSSAVIAFEPRPAQAKELAAMFGCVGVPVQVEAVALSEQTGESALRVLVSDPGRSTIEYANTLTDGDGSAVETIDVPCRRLDDFALDNVGFVKIDVEGHELSVLRGARTTIERNRPAFLIEAEERHRQHAVVEMTSFLYRLGYDGYFLTEDGQWPIAEFNPEKHQNPANIASWRDGWARTGVYVNNFVFLPKS